MRFFYFYVWRTARHSWHRELPRVRSSRGGVSGGQNEVREARSGKQRYMCGGDPPALEQAHPHLALASGNGPAIDGALELQGDAAEVAAKGDDVQEPHGALEIHRRTAVRNAAISSKPCKFSVAPKRIA